MANILIIGGGVSGLSAGIYAQMLGHSATICEKHSIPGGNLTAWRRNGYTIDNCIHWLTGTNPATETYKMWCELGALGNVDVFQGETLYTCEQGDQRLSLNKDLHITERDMLSISPADKKEIRSLVRAVEIMQGICGIGGKDHNRKLSAKQVALAIPSLLKYYNLTAKELSERFSHPLLRLFVSSFWGNDFGALALITVFAHFCGENGGIPEGGSLAMAKRMAERFRSLGGSLLLNKEAVKIDLENRIARSVRFSDSTSISADYVIITADPATAFKQLLSAPLPQKLDEKYKDPRQKRFSSYQVAFACDAESLPFKGDLIFNTPHRLRSTLKTDRMILREYTHEKSFAPEGCCILQSLTFCSEEDALDFIKLRSSDKSKYAEKKMLLSKAVEEAITTQIPHLQGHLACIDVWTPATYKRFTSSEIGSYMSFVLPSKALPVKLGCRIKGVDNLLLATQWQQSPGGLPIAAECGKIAANTAHRLSQKHNAAKIDFKF